MNANEVGTVTRAEFDQLSQDYRESLAVMRAEIKTLQNRDASAQRQIAELKKDLASVRNQLAGVEDDHAAHTFIKPVRRKRALSLSSDTINESRPLKRRTYDRDEEIPETDPESISSATMENSPENEEQAGWKTLDIGVARKSSKTSNSVQLRDSSLPEALKTRIRAFDLTRKANREDNIKVNQGGRATVCWLSHFFPSDWAKANNTPKDNRTLVVRRELTEWWSAKWVDTTRECPQCRNRKYDGEEGIVCFYFLDPRNIRYYG